MGNATETKLEEILYERRKGKGKGVSRNSMGKGRGRKRNPIGKNGQIMKCLGNNGQCRSEFHLKRNCLHETGKGAPGGKGSTSVQFTDHTYVTEIENLHYITAQSVDHRNVVTGNGNVARTFTNFSHDRWTSEDHGNVVSDYAHQIHSGTAEAGM